MSAEATNISKLSIITEAKSGEAVKSLQSLASALSTLKNASKGNYNGLNKAADAIKNLMAQIHTISEADLGKLERLAAALSGIKGFKFSSGRTSSAKTRGGKVSPYTPLAGGGGGNGGGTNRPGGGTAWDAGGGSTGIDLDKMFADNGGGKGGWGKVASAALQKALGGISGFFKSIGRIAVYRLIRRGLQIISEGIKEGYKNALEWSRLNNTSLYPSMQKVATATLVMKNQLGAAAGELLQNIAPALINISEVITNIAEQFANMFAVLGGRSQYMRAKRNIDGVTASQEKLNRTILAFDEINKLNGNNPYGDASINDMFEMVDVNVAEAKTLEATLKTIGMTLAALSIAKFVLQLQEAVGWASKLATALGGSGAASAAGVGAKGLLGAGGAAAGGGGVLGALGAILPYAALLAEIAAVSYLGYKNFQETMDTLNRAHELGVDPRALPGFEPSGIAGTIIPKNWKDYPNSISPYAESYRGLVDPSAGWAVRDNPLATTPTTDDGWAARMPGSQEITLTILDPNGTVLSRDPLSKYYADSIRVGSVIVGNGSVR